MSERIQGRLRFLESRLEKLPDDRWTAQVSLAGTADRVHTGAADRDRGPDGDVWCVAEATLTALRQALSMPAAALRIRDVVAFEIDGSPAIAVSLMSDVDGQKRKLFGLCQADEDRARGAALAVLSATNRFFGDS
jgi:hypothetical protein